MIQDLRLAIRTLSRSRLFVAIAVATLALGIGADTAAFSLVDAILFRPLNFPASGRLVDVSEWSATKLCAGCGVGTSHLQYAEWKAGASAFDDMGAYLELPLAVSDTGPADRVSGALASASMFTTLGVRPHLGRLFTADDDRIGAPPVALLSYTVWTRRFRGDSGIVGRTVRINGVERTVVGVLPADFHFPEFAAVWLPLEPNARPTTRDARDIGVIARLRSGTDVAHASTQMATLAAVAAREHPEANAEWTARVKPLRETLAGTEAQLFVILLGAISLVLLIVCANLAGLLLARGAGRHREIAVRLALGATRGQIVRTMLAESAILTAAGGVAGLLLAWWTVDLVATQFAGFVPNWMEFRVDARVLAYCAVTSIIAGIAFGLLPALRAADTTLHTELKDGASAAGTGLGRSRLRSAMVVGELAVALVLLSASGLLIKSFLRISATAEQEDRVGLVTAQLDFLDRRYESPAQLAAAAEGIAQRVAVVPGVRFAALSSTQFLAGFGARDRRIRVDGIANVPEGVSPRFANAVTPAFFKTLGLSLSMGREFSATDRAGTSPVVVVPEGMARALWPGANPVGRRIALSDSAGAPWWTVVGVLADRELGRARSRNAANLIYVPLAQWPGKPMTLHVRAPADKPLSIVRALRAAVAEVDRDLPVLDLMTAQQAHDQTYWPYKLYAIVMSAFGALAVLLAVLGVYGIVAYGVAQRTREISIRVALGARQGDVTRLITGQGIRLAITGIVIGLVLSAGVLRVLQSLLFGASPMDPMVFLGVALLIGGSAALASYVPALRASRVDPLTALRAE